MANVINQEVGNGVTLPTYQSATVSDSFSYVQGRNFAHYRNSSGTARTLTVVMPKLTSYGDSDTDHVLTLPANGELMFAIFQDALNGSNNVVVTLDDATGVTVASLSRVLAS